MKATKLRSRKKKIRRTRTPGGKIILLVRTKRHSQLRCRRCHQIISGVPKMSIKEVKNIRKDDKRPQRPYGSSLCTNCVRFSIRSSIWSN